MPKKRISRGVYGICCILKLHGGYNDARIFNIDAGFSSYFAHHALTLNGWAAPSKREQGF